MAAPMETPIHELTQEGLESLPARERDAVNRLLRLQDAGKVSMMSSMNDLTPPELASEFEAEDRALRNVSMSRSISRLRAKGLA